MNDGLFHDLEFAGDDRHGVEEHGGQDDPDDPQETRQATESEGREGRAEGHAKGQAGNEEGGEHAEERRIGGGDAQVLRAVLVTMGVQGDEVQ